jgi:hypothetical protein
MGGGVGGAERRAGNRRGPRDPYPLSPTGSTVGLGWPRNDSRLDDHPRVNEREAEEEETAQSDNHQRADIVMSLDAHGKVVRQGRAPIVDWADAEADGRRVRSDRRSGGGGGGGGGGGSFVASKEDARGSWRGGHSKRGSGLEAEMLR